MKKINEEQYKELRTKIIKNNKKAQLYLDAEIQTGAEYVCNDGAVAYIIRKGKYFEFGGFISFKKGAGAKLLKDIIKKYEKIELFCIGDGLRDYYQKFGFKVEAILKWDDNYAPQGWNYDKLGRPDLYIMRNF